jgi:hypothetical protein
VHAVAVVELEPLHLDVELQFYDLIGQNEEEPDPVYLLDLLQLLPIKQTMQ